MSILCQTWHLSGREVKHFSSSWTVIHNWCFLLACYAGDQRQQRVKVSVKALKDKDSVKPTERRQVLCLKCYVAMSYVRSCLFHHCSGVFGVFFNMNMLYTLYSVFFCTRTSTLHKYLVLYLFSSLSCITTNTLPSVLSTVNTAWYSCFPEAK